MGRERGFVLLYIGFVSHNGIRNENEPPQSTAVMARSILGLSDCLEVGLVNFEVRLRMSTDRALFRSAGANYDMTAVAALPHLDF